MRNVQAFAPVKTIFLTYLKDISQKVVIVISFVQAISFFVLGRIRCKGLS